MTAQAQITKSVIDAPLRFPQCADMLTHDEIREELIRQLDANKLKPSEVAMALNIARARVSEMRKRDRRVQQNEMPKLAVLLGMAEEQSLRSTAVEQEAQVPYLGKVAAGVWLEQSLPITDPEDQEFVSYDRLRGDPAAHDLFAVEPDGTSMNLAFPDPRTKLICRKVPFGDALLEPGRYVIVERKAHDLHETTCKLVEIDDEGVFWLVCESSDPKYKDERWRIGKPSTDHHSDTEITVIANVVRAVIDYDRPRKKLRKSY